MNYTRLCLGAAALSLWWAADAQAWFIGFDELPIGTIVTDQYPSATFSADSGEANYVVADPRPGHPTNRIIATGANGTPTFLENTYVDFFVPMRAVGWLGIFPQATSGRVATIRFFENYVYAGSRDIIRTGGPGAVQYNNLGFDNVTRMEFVDITQPVGWDAFGMVPEPTTICAVGAGLALVWRRRSSRASR